ncbi:MAG: phage terminase large subunit family protein [Lentisphaeraceae bacterium]|nr:phage terminase large subunit family protein [Lentisphaeraceae bacterium]
MRITTFIILFFSGVFSMVALPENVYQQAFAEGLLPPDRLSIDECANKYRRLPQDTSEGAGQLIDTSRTPYVKGITACLDPSSPIQQVIAMKGAQIALSTAAENFGFHTIKYGLGKFMYVMPTNAGIRSVSTEKFAPMIADSPEITDLVASPSSRTQTNTVSEKEFLGGRLLFKGATSAKGLRQTSVGKFVVDEEDAMEVTKEGDPIEILKKRAITFGRRLKMFRLSTPLLKGFSRIEKGYEESDQRVYKIPCPHCSHYQTLDWERFNKVPANVYMTCENIDCEEPIYEDQKHYFLGRGKWVRRYNQIKALCDFDYGDKKFLKGHPHWVKVEDMSRLIEEGKVEDIVQTIAGFHISGLYSPLGWYSWETAVVEYNAALGDPTKMQVFVNTILGLSYEEHIQHVEAADLLKRKTKICLKQPEAEIPERAVLITCALDTQNNRLEALVVAWGLTEDGQGIERWIIDKEIFYGDPAENDPWIGLEDFRKKTYLSERGDRMHMNIIGIDTAGGRTQYVYDYCNRHRGILALKGGSGEGHPIAKHRSKIKTDYGYDIDLHFIGTHTCKSRIFTILQDGYEGHDKITFPDEEFCDREFFEQLTAEKLITYYREGLPYRKWAKTRARNEVLDLMVYNQGLLYYVSNNPRRHLEILSKKLLNQSSKPQASSMSKRRKSNVKKSKLL